MDEPVIRVVVVAAVAVSMLLVARRSQSVKHQWPRGVLDGPAVTFFSSKTCESCREARALLDETFGTRYREIAWEDDPDGWVAFGVESVPMVVLVDRRGVVVDDMVGLPISSTLVRWRRRMRRL